MCGESLPGEQVNSEELPFQRQSFEIDLTSQRGTIARGLNRTSRRGRLGASVDKVYTGRWGGTHLYKDGI